MAVSVRPKKEKNGAWAAETYKDSDLRHFEGRTGLSVTAKNYDDSQNIKHQERD
jgi:hypothetical protein